MSTIEERVKIAREAVLAIRKKNRLRLQSINPNPHHNLTQRVGFRASRDIRLHIHWRPRQNTDS